MRSLCSVVDLGRQESRCLDASHPYSWVSRMGSCEAHGVALTQHVIGVHWIKVFTKEQAKTFKGVFANQNIVCKLRHPETVAFLKRVLRI